MSDQEPQQPHANTTPRSILSWLRGSIEVGVLVILMLITGAGWLLLELTDEVVEGATTGFDETILLALRVPGDLSDPIGPPQVEEAARDLTALGGVVVIAGATLLVGLFFWIHGRVARMLYLWLAVGGGVLLSSFAKEFFNRPRPELVPHGSLVETASFPSGHSMMAAVAYLSLGAMLATSLGRRREKIYVLSIAVIITVLVGISRVYLGVHWPTDVMAGWLAGIVWALLCMLFARLVFPARNLPVA